MRKQKRIRQVRRLPMRRRQAIAITLPEPLIASADELASRLFMSRSTLIEYALQRAISEQPGSAAEIFVPQKEAV